MPEITSDELCPVKQAIGQKLRALKAESPEKLVQTLIDMDMTEQEAKEMAHDPMYWCRPNQHIDLSQEATTILLLSGRGFGKTFAGMYTLYRAVELHNVKKILLIARTARDIRSTIVPAIEDMYYEGHPNYPHWSMGKSNITWPNGAEAICIAAEAGSSSVRGINSELIICDEMAFYQNNEDIIDMAFFTLRHSPSKFIGLTSPNATEKIMQMYEAWRDGDKSISIISGSTYDNQENLSKGFMDNIVRSYEGTSLAAAELHGELLLQNKDALWDMETINRNLLKDIEIPEEWDHISIGCDPALLSHKGAGKRKRRPDSTGLIVSGVANNGQIITIDNHTGNYSTEQWAMKVAHLYDYWKERARKVSIYIESNLHGEENLQMIFRNIERTDVFKHIKCEFSTQNKMSRLQPYALLAEQDKIKYADKSSMQPLFRELTTFTGLGKSSPDNADAACFSWMLLKPKRKSFTSTTELLI